MIAKLLSLFTKPAQTLVTAPATPEPVELVFVGAHHPLASRVGIGYADPRWLASFGSW